jgi:hypothetical protein
VPLQTSAGHWIVDKQWQLRANPVFRENERKKEELDKHILVKRRNGRILKNMALE